MTVTPDDVAVVKEWLRVHAILGYSTAMQDKLLVPVLERILASLASDEGAIVPDPYAGKRTTYSKSDVFGGNRDQGITRKSEQ